MNHQYIPAALPKTQEGRTPTLYPPIFGDEPTHTWCYDYEKAKLALQKNGWEKVIQLGDEAIQNSEYPIDRVEWIPFLQAYAHIGDAQRLRNTTSRINEYPFLQQQACRTLQKMIQFGLVTDPLIQSLIIELFCS